MEIDLDTFLVTGSCVVAELYREHFAPHKPRRPGRRPALSDSEVLTLALLAQWQAQRSERAFRRYARAHWRRYSPALLGPSPFNRRVRDVGGVLCRRGPVLFRALAAAGGAAPASRVRDCVPAPLTRRCRGDRHQLFGPEAAVGHGGAAADWDYGVQLLPDVTDAGAIAGFVLAPADTDDRGPAEALVRWRVPALGTTTDRGGARTGPSGPIAPRQAVGQVADGPALADLGVAGIHWQRHRAQDYGALVLTRRDFQGAPAAAAPRAAARAHAHRRQVVERVNGWLEDRRGLHFPRARTYRGLLTRMAAKVPPSTSRACSTTGGAASPSPASAPSRRPASMPHRHPGSKQCASRILRQPVSTYILRA